MEKFLGNRYMSVITERSVECTVVMNSDRSKSKISEIPPSTISNQVNNEEEVKKEVQP